jgi:hypothetical protein
MKYTEEEIVAYARSRIRSCDQQTGKRLVLGIMGIGVIVMFLCLIQLINEKSEKIGSDWLLDQRFIEGIGMGIFIILSFGCAALPAVRMFACSYGKETEAFRLLVKLKEEKSG